MTKAFRTNLALSFLFSCVGSVLLPFVPAVSTWGGARDRIGAYLLAGAFWFSILCELFFVFRCSKERKGVESARRKSGRFKNAAPGIASFFKNYEATAADILLFLSIVAIAVVLRTKVKNEWVVVSLASLFLLFFQMHCLLNGKNYGYYKLSREKSREESNRHD